ncbi:hypothetical protein [Fulvivirga lutea]|uniref:SprB repeat-containing protein n=1 Tax=Fulvivirga lutea TaxID=2810512 RepID=A0A975A2D1_9BACT|nr:hypothetical protein [Fulvivirga lutea]QSE98711.1 hypothetical protein JR347_06420 [Fulvivirga lutea]
MEVNKVISIILILAIFGIFSCTYDQIEPQVDCTTSPVEMVLIESKDAECSSSNGSFSVAASGGELPYTFSSEAGSNSDGVFSNVAAGTYNVIVKDAKGCSSELAVTIQNLGGVNLDDITASEAGCGSANGSIQVAVSGGEEPYSFFINGGAAQTSNVFNGLDAGSYSITAIDNLDCEVKSNVKITSGVSYQSSIKGIIETNCAISGCHNGSVSPNLTSFSSIQSSANRIEARTANRSMPRGRTLTQQEIDMIACWVDDGALQN